MKAYLIRLIKFVIYMFLFYLIAALYSSFADISMERAVVIGVVGVAIFNAIDIEVLERKVKKGGL